MKLLRVNFANFVKFKWNAKVSSWRHGIGVEYNKKNQVAKVVDELQETIRQALKNCLEAIFEDFDEKYQMVYRGAESDRDNEDQWDKFIDSKKKVQFWFVVEAGIERANKGNW